MSEVLNESKVMIRVHGVEYIYKYIADKNEQALREETKRLFKNNIKMRDKIEELEHQNSGLRQKLRGKFEWNEIE